MSTVTDKLRGEEKLKRIPIKIPVTQEALPKPSWIKIQLTHNPAVQALKKKLRDHGLVTVCEEATCPNLHECYSHGTATFMIMGDKCTRRCSFCDVAHGRPDPLDTEEPNKLANVIADMQLQYVVITSVDRDDLRDGGAQHFVNCMQAVRAKSPAIQIEILVPDFRGRMDKALAIFENCQPDVFNHNIETVPNLYKQARPGSDYQHSLALLKRFKEAHPHLPTKSGLMLGLGETDEQVINTLIDLRKNLVDRVTLGQYLSPSPYHLPVTRYVEPEHFAHLKTIAEKLGFSHVASGPLVRSSYHADLQAQGKNIQ